MNFEISAQEIKLSHLNVRAEKHGDGDVTAIDLKLVWITSNESLALFDAGLARLIYGPETKQQAMDGMGPKTMRAFPSLGPLEWKEEVTGLRLTIEPGISGKSALVLNDCIADRFTIEPLDGGSVKIIFRMRTSSADERTLGKLALLINHDLPMAIVHTGETQVGDVVPITAKASGRKQKSVEDAFLGN